MLFSFPSGKNLEINRETGHTTRNIKMGSMICAAIGAMNW